MCDARAVIHVGIANLRWWWTQSRHCRGKRNTQVYVSAKRSMQYTPSDAMGCYRTWSGLVRLMVNCPIEPISLILISILWHKSGGIDQEVFWILFIEMHYIRIWIIYYRHICQGSMCQTHLSKYDVQSSVPYPAYKIILTTIASKM